MDKQYETRRHDERLRSCRVLVLWYRRRTEIRGNITNCLVAWACLC